MRKNIVIIMEALPEELILKTSEYLSPSERWRLSACNRRYREILPVWLRLRILSRVSKATLNADFYVTRATSKEDPSVPADQNESQPLLHHESLEYGVEYWFWTYDYKRQNRVFLGRHGQKYLSTSDPPFIYTLGLRPRIPDQTWTVTRGQEENDRNQESDESRISRIPNGELVPFESSIGLTVGGTHEKRNRPDSKVRQYLSVHALYIGSLWYVVQNKEWAADENLQLVRSSEFPSAVGTLVSKEGLGEGKVSERDLIVHAIPDVLDGGSSLLSPESLEDGSASCDLYHATVPFHFWIVSGMMYFHAFETLSFTFGVPILEEDKVDSDSKPVDPLKILLKKNSSRWWAIKHYMSTAADLAEGRDFDMVSFIRSAKDHEDHSIMYDSAKDLVYIEVQNSVIEERYPQLQKNSSVWKFLLCG